MREPAAALSTLLLAIWFALSVLRYVPRIGAIVDRYDRVFLVPHWTFFAPNPNRADYYLYVRVSSGSELSPWHELHLGPGRAWYAAAWNPGRRTRKALIDLCQALGQLRHRTREDILLSLPYLLLLTVVSAHVARAPGNLCQFAVVTVVPSVVPDDPNLYFISDIHSIAA